LTKTTADWLKRSGTSKATRSMRDASDPRDN
jgi:hypothetical protein